MRQATFVKGFLAIGVVAACSGPISPRLSCSSRAQENGDVIFTQSKTYVELSGSSVYQSMSSGKCREL